MKSTFYISEIHSCIISTVSLLIYFNYSFFITVERSHNTLQCHLVYHISVIGNGNVLIKFLFRFLVEIFSRLACAFALLLPGEFSSRIHGKGRGVSIISIQLSLCSSLPLS